MKRGTPMDTPALVRSYRVPETDLTVELWAGDITAMGDVVPLDVLAVSAFPGSYQPVPGTVIGALEKRGIRVAYLRAEHLGGESSDGECWWTDPVTFPGVGCFRLLCFEPRSSAADLAGHLSRVADALEIMLEDRLDATLTLPRLATGNQGADQSDVTYVLVDDLVTRTARGELPLSKIRLVIFDDGEAQEVAEELADLLG